MNKPSILIIDPDYGEGSFLQDLFNSRGFEAKLAMSASKARELALILVPDVIFLEIDIPETDGIELAAEFRTIPALKNSYVIFCSSQNDNFLQISAYNAGADDFLFKPLNERIFLAKWISLVKRLNLDNRDQRNELIRIDHDRYVALKGNQEITLPRKEFEILSFLISHPGKVFSRDNIKDEIWGQNGGVRSRTIDVHIKKLREKVGHEIIRTIKGVGYKFEQSFSE